MQIIEEKLDDQQLQIKNILDELAYKINQSQTIISKIKSFFLAQNNFKNSVYLHGKVGRGKTMLMRYYYDTIVVPKKILHFQTFMRRVHEDLHKLKVQNVPLNLIVKKLAQKIAFDAKVLCLDEFEVNDIADAMIIMELFRRLYKHQVIIFLTTNTEPKNLYKNGLQRESFLPFIQSVYDKFLILSLNNQQDYRTLLGSQGKRIFAPSNNASHAAIKEIKSELSIGAKFGPNSTEIFGRKIIFNNATNNIIFTDFNELFERNFSYADYGHITNIYKIIVLENVRTIEENETDIIVRFINFIDNAYYNHILLFLESECALNQIYIKGKKLHEFERVLSRLVEMDGALYYNNYKAKL